MLQLGHIMIMGSMLHNKDIIKVAINKVVTNKDINNNIIHNNITSHSISKKNTMPQHQLQQDRIMLKKQLRLLLILLHHRNHIQLNTNSNVMNHVNQIQQNTWPMYAVLYMLLH